MYPGALPMTDIGPRGPAVVGGAPQHQVHLPASTAQCRRPSAKASSQGPARTAAGIRNAAYVDSVGGNRRIEFLQEFGHGTTVPDEDRTVTAALVSSGRMTPCRAAKILVVDNYDSFVYNLVQYLAQIGAEVEVWRNDDPRFADPTSPTASTASCSRPARHPGGGRRLRRRGPAARRAELPIFGVCLGLQAIGVAYGGVVDRAPELLHGKTSCAPRRAGVLAGLPRPFTATRYHSLAIEPDTVPDELEVTAATPSGVIMAVRHRELPVEAVQFHPESVLTEGGYQMLANWLAICGDPEAPTRAVGMAPLMSAQRSDGYGSAGAITTLRPDLTEESSVPESKSP